MLARGGEAAAALSPLALQPRGRGPLHQDAAAVLLQLLLERLRVALRVGQQVKEALQRAVRRPRAAAVATCACARLPCSPTRLPASLLQVLAGELTARAAELVGDARLPTSETLALRLMLIGALREEGQRLAQVPVGLPAGRSWAVACRRACTACHAAR